MDESMLAKKFLIKECMTHFKLQKLCYYAQAWYFTVYGEPLINSDFEAWEFGPVNSTIYGEYSDYGYPSEGSSALESIPRYNAELPKTPQDEHINLVYELYGKHKDTMLGKISHAEDPWNDARKEFLTFLRSSNTVIPLESMRKFYETQGFLTLFSELKLERQPDFKIFRLIDHLDITPAGVVVPAEMIDYEKNQGIYHSFEKKLKNALQNVLYDDDISDPVNGFKYFLCGNYIYLANRRYREYLISMAKNTTTEINDLFAKLNVSFKWSLMDDTEGTRIIYYSIVGLGINVFGTSLDEVSKNALESIKNTREALVETGKYQDKKPDRFLLIEKLYLLASINKQDIIECLELNKLPEHIETNVLGVITNEG